jgi:Ca-activated chloride channel family protein
MIGFRFSAPDDDASGSPFERLFKLFKELLLHTSGDVPEALSWLTELDRTYRLTDDSYGIADFVRDLTDQGYIRPPAGGANGPFSPTKKMEIALRRSALEDVFGQLKKARRGNHATKFGGRGDEPMPELRPFEFGDKLDQIAVSESLKNAYINHGIEDFTLAQSDLEVHETHFQSQSSTVLMIDISHSMILYGEDRITPAKKVAMALAELIRTQYPKDTLDVLVFGNDAWPIQVKDLPYLEVGPYHTNTVAGLELALELLRKRRNPNKQIFMITDGKPSCIKVGKQYYKNSFGLDRKIVGRCLTLAQRCRKLDIPITTFMIAEDPYLMRFVDEFTRANNGKAFYSSLKGLGEFVFRDYRKGKK